MLAFVLAAMALDPGGVASCLRGALFDAYQRHDPFADDPGAASPPTLVLEVDSGQWPWRSTMLARLIGELKAAGAGLVVFTFPFDSTEASPQSLLDQIPPDHEFDPARTEIASLPAPGERLAEALQGMKAVTGIALGAAGADPLLKARFAYQGPKAPFAQVPSFAAARAPPEVIGNASAGIAALNLFPDADGALRRMPLLFRVGAKIVPSPDAEALRILGQSAMLTVKGDENTLGTMLGLAPGIAALEAGREIATAPDGSFWIAYAARDAPSISSGALENGTVALHGATVFVGAPGMRVGTPFGARTLASAEAQGLENLLTGEALRRPEVALAAESLWLVLFAAISVFLVVRLGPLWAGLFALAVILGGGFISWNLFVANHALFDAAGPGVGLVLILATGTFARMAEIRAARARLRIAFAESLPAATIEKIARRPSLLKVDGETRTVTYLACGLRGFAGLAASFRDDPAAFTRLIQRVLTPLMDQVLAHGGTIDRLTADGFAAFWNAPLDDPAHALHACEAASGMSVVAARVNEFITQERRLDGRALAPVEIGVGLATGSVIAGGFRGHGRTGYSVNGDAILLAGRIQLLSPQYGPAVIVSEETARAAERGFAFLEVDFIAAGENDAPVKLYALLGNPVTRASPKFRALQTFHEHIFAALRARQWKAARELIEQCRKLSGASQKLYDLHLARIAYFETSPPAENWDGAFRPILK